MKPLKFDTAYSRGKTIKSILDILWHIRNFALQSLESRAGLLIVSCIDKLLIHLRPSFKKNTSKSNNNSNMYYDADSKSALLVDFAQDKYGTTNKSLDSNVLDMQEGLVDDSVFKKSFKEFEYIALLFSERKKKASKGSISSRNDTMKKKSGNDDGDNEMIIRVKQCGICGTDLHASDGGSMEPPTGTIFGHEFSGEIVEIGKNINSSWKIGDPAVSLPFISCGKSKPCINGNPFFCEIRTTSTGMSPEIQGGYAEFVRIGLPESVKIPKGVSWDFASLVEPLAVGLHGVRVSKFKQGHRALVIGAGPIGLATIQWLRFFGARHIVVAEISEERKKMAEEMGATLIIDGKTPPEELAVIYNKETGGSPDIIYECVGFPNVIQNCMEIAAPFSEIVLIGVCDKPDTFMPFLGTIKELTLKFAIAYLKDDFQFTVDMMEQGRIDPSKMITNQIGFNELPDTFEALKTSKDQCKVMICPNH